MTATGYEYTASPIVQPKQSDALDHLRAAVSGTLPAPEAAPAPAPEPEKAAKK